MGLPTRHGGLGVHDPAEMAKTLHQGAVRVTEPLVNHILQHQDSTHDHEDDRQADQAFEEALSSQRDATKRQREEWDTGMQEKAKALRERLGHDSTAALAMRWAEQRGTSTWLTALPLVSHGFDLTRREFYDALCLRYGWEPAKMPTTCACGQRFSLEHALTCQRGGYITMRHDEVRDLFTTSDVSQRVIGARASAIEWSAPPHSRRKSNGWCPSRHQGWGLLGPQSV